MMEIIGGIILLGFVILVLTGLGILTTAIFNSKEITDTVLTKDPRYLEYIKNKPTSNSYSEADKAKEIASLSNDYSLITGTGKYIIKLSSINLTVSKISLITFWILIAIFVLVLIFSKHDLLDLFD